MTAEGEHDYQIKDSRKDVNSFLETRDETDEEMDLRFARTAEGFSKLEETMGEQQRQKPSLENRPADKSSSE